MRGAKQEEEAAGVSVRGYGDSHPQTLEDFWQENCREITSEEVLDFGHNGNLYFDAQSYASMEQYAYARLSLRKHWHR